MANLADILVTLTLDTTEFSRQLQRVGQDLNNFRNHMNQVTSNMNQEFTENISEMTDSIQDLSNSTHNMGQSITQSTNNISQSMNNVSQSSRYLSRTLGTSLQDIQRVLEASTREFNRFGDAGRHVSQEIRDEFSALPRHLQRYVQRLREAGRSTDEFARLNEMYGARIIEAHRRSNDYFQQRTTQSQRLMNSFANDTNLSPLTNGFLRLGDSMEQTARQGSVLNLALQRIGNNTSLKNLQDQMRFIQQGIMRARGAFLVFGISAGLATWGMIELASAVDDRVAPAFENLKSTWLDAMMPFITTFATGMVAVMNFVTAIGKMVGAFSEAHPVIFSMLMSIAMLTLALGALLAPLAVTGIWAEGVAASFGALWAIIAPFVTGVLAVIGVALALATALVVVFVAIQNLWKHSEAFRNAFINIWNDVKSAVVDKFVAPVQQAWENLKSAFSTLIATITGGTGTMGNLWTWLGDHLAVVVSAIASVVLPLLSSAFALLGTGVSAVINGLATVFGWLASMWATHGDTITAVAQKIWSKIVEAFGAISEYIKSIMPEVKSIVSDVFTAIGAVIDFTMSYIAPVVVKAFQIIGDIISSLMPLILSIIKGTWENIKSVISSTIAIIQNVIQLFSNVLKGNWSEAWENVKNILSNALTLVWNLVQLYFLGKLLAPIKGFMSAGTSLVTSTWTGFLNIIKSILTNTQTFIVGVWTAIKSALSGSFSGIYNLAVTTFTNLRTQITTIFNACKSTATTVWEAVKNAIVNPIETAKETVLKIISTIVKAFASMKISIPEVKLPKINVGSKSFLDGKVTIPTFSVSWNATGNIFNGASILGGGQGVGEAGAEVVMPIERKRYMKPYASMVAGIMAKNSGNTPSQGTEINGDIHITVNADDLNKVSDVIALFENLKQASRRM